MNLGQVVDMERWIFIPVDPFEDWIDVSNSILREL